MRSIALCLVLALTALVLLAPRPASANGVPIRIPLTYLPGLSNWGPADARGEAEVSFSEALVRLDVHGLPPLRGETYQLWLAKSGTNKAVAAGTFTTGPDGSGGLTGKLTGLDGYDYDLLLVTVESVPDTDPAPSTRRSIGGFFAPVKRPEQQASGITADTMPAALPNTGDALPARGDGRRHTLAMILFGVGGLSLVLALQRRRSMQ